MYKLAVFIPKSHLEVVKTAMFEAGGGRIGNYDCCSWQTLGSGQFRPLPGSNPFIGEQQSIEIVREYKVELVCDDEYVRAVIMAMRASHPYEEPAFDLFQLTDPDTF